MYIVYVYMHVYIICILPMSTTILTKLEGGGVMFTRCDRRYMYTCVCIHIYPYIYCRKTYYIYINKHKY